jgi:hypothetical protein
LAWIDEFGSTSGELASLPSARKDCRRLEDPTIQLNGMTEGREIV